MGLIDDELAKRTTYEEVAYTKSLGSVSKPPPAPTAGLINQVIDALRNRVPYITIKRQAKVAGFSITFDQIKRVHRKLLERQAELAPKEE